MEELVLTCGCMRSLVIPPGLPRKAHIHGPAMTAFEMQAHRSQFLESGEKSGELVMLCFECCKSQQWEAGSCSFYVSYSIG